MMSESIKERVQPIQQQLFQNDAIQKAGQLATMACHPTKKVNKASELT